MKHLYQTPDFGPNSRIFLLLVVFCFLSVFESFAQNNSDIVRYKVTAYKAGDPAIYSVSNVVAVPQTMHIYLPNTFTPNNDGMNDEFGATGKAIKAYSIVIYNRWGEIVFHSDDLSKKWDGTFHGENAPAGVYLFTVNATGYAGDVAYSNGSVTLLR